MLGAPSGLINGDSCEIYGVKVIFLEAHRKFLNYICLLLDKLRFEIDIFKFAP